MSPVFGHGRLRLYLLKLLDESPRHGYDVIRELEDRFMGMYTPSAGTVYPRLARLETEGLVTHEVHEGRKVYQITDAGRAELSARRGELDDLEAEIAGSVRDFATEIRSEVRGSVKDLRQELKAAAKDMRRQARAEGRQARAEARPTGRPDIAELSVLAEWARGELRNEARRRMPTPEQVSEVRAILERALADVRRVLSGPQTGGSEGGSASTGVDE
jgi:DNA-binding PadR family transcriptional regulator